MSAARRVVVEPEPLHRPRRVVLGDRVGPLDDETADERDGVGMLEVQASRCACRRSARRTSARPRARAGCRVRARTRAGSRDASRDSIRRTVAPCSTKYRVAMGPAAPEPSSRMCTPSQAARPGDQVAFVGRCSRSVNAASDAAAPRRWRPWAGRGRLAVVRADLHEGTREALDVVERHEEATGLELHAGEDLPRRVGRGEHEVRLARVLVELAHRVPGEVLGDRLARPRAAPPRRRCWGSTSLQSCASSADASMPSAATSFVIISSVGMRALPAPQPERDPTVGRRPDLAGPLALRAEPTCRVSRSSAKPAGNAMFATSTHSCIERSMRCGCPVHSAVSTANAASPPVCAYPDGSVHRTGGRSGLPVGYMFPLLARTPRSDARHEARGPVRPNGVTLSHTA